VNRGVAKQGRRAHYPRRVARTPASVPQSKLRARFRRRGRGGPQEPKGPSTRARFVQSYRIARKHEPLIWLWPLGGFLGPAIILSVLGVVFGHPVLLPLMGVVIGLLLGANLFAFRAQRGIYAEAADNPGVALQVVRQMRGDWKITEAVQFNRNQEFVHRVVGRPGVVLIAEGRSRNVRDLLASEARRTRRIAPDVQVHEIIVGTREGDLPLMKLRSHLGKLPRQLRAPAIRALDVKLKAVANTSLPIPKGPMPTRVPRGRAR
jgi:uncharacterized protein YneF (UPF0154 family)